MKRYVIVGAGSRMFTMFLKGLEDKIGKNLEITGVYDTNRTRCEFYKKNLDTLTIYTDFDEMIRCEKPDAVIIGTVDSKHKEYVVRSLELGCDVVCEKPLCNTYEDCLEIMECERRTGKKVTVTFNCRFMPYFAKLKELVMSGAIGKVHAISYNYTLNRWHGGDYFKRWHGKMDISKGMLLHKSTHHFDVMNWVLDDLPEKVSAMGLQSFYAKPEKSFGERCRDCKLAEKCESYRSQSEKLDEELYFKAEHEDGYIRDKCAYLPDSDINDNLSVTVMYRKGTIMTYTLNLFSMREGYTMTLTGEKGNIIVSTYKSDYGEGETRAIKLMTKENETVEIPVETVGGAHGGGDVLLREMIFGESDAIDDPLGQCADSFAGVASAMIGIAANESIADGKFVDLRERLEKLRG